MSQKIRILGINGSPRKFGGTVKMLKEVLQAAQKNGATTKLIHLLDYKMKPYHGNYYKKPDREVLRLLDEMEKFDGYVFATPTHWMGPSSLMKILIDNLTYWEMLKNFKLEGKVVGVVTHSELDGGFTVAQNLLGILNTMGAIGPPYAVNTRNKNIKKTKETEWMWTDTKLLGKNIVLLSEMVRKLKPNWDYEKNGR